MSPCARPRKLLVVADLAERMKECVANGEVPAFAHRTRRLAVAADNVGLQESREVALR